MPRALITGAAGDVARGILPHLDPSLTLRLLDLAPPGDDPRRVQGDILDADCLQKAMQDIDAVLHLAVASGHAGPYEDDAFNDLRFDINVKGTHRLFEAARRAGVRRVVYASSLMVVWGYGAEEVVPGDAAPRPVGTYALTKTLGEEIARHYARTHGIETVIVRIAAPLDLDDPDLRKNPVRPQQVPFPDLAQAFSRALTVPLTGTATVTIIGESSRRRWDLGPAQRILGYQPRYRLDDLGVTFAEPFAVEAK